MAGGQLQLDAAVLLRPAVPADFGFAWSVYADGLRPHLSAWRCWEDADQQRRFARIYDPVHSAIVLCAGEAAGFLTITGHESTILLQQFFLAAGFRGRGLGSHLLGRLCAEWNDMDRPVSLAVLQNNPAQNLYRRHGFATYWQNDDRFFMLRPPPAR
ncbi:N-acetyltransferase family protein [Ferrovibrio sp.]|uniref:GNAT family N-acetyltransferase n=1 Tax=Ferrovibrio sp. TaxID=1917215 RepID=UPI00351335C4